MPLPNRLPAQGARELLKYPGRGNPPSVLPSVAISNCFPGLEFDFRAVWKHLLVGVELHESINFVAQDPTGPAFTAGVRRGTVVISIAGQELAGAEANTIDWSNTAAGLLVRAGEQVPVAFSNGDAPFTVNLQIQNPLDGLVLRDEETAVPPGALTQGLCSPWQADYRECGCFYWAASRPDFINVEVSQSGAAGHNWMQKNRGTGPKQYQPDRPSHNPTSPQITYEDLYRNWERELKFVIEGKDETILEFIGSPLL